MSNLILRLAFGLAAVLSIGSSLLAQEATKPAPLVPDLSWRPKVGDTASVYSKGLDRIPCATQLIWYSEFDKVLKAKDGAGFNEMMEKKQVIFVKNGTPVLVLEAHNNQFVADHEVLEVRLMDGPDKGRKAFITRAWVARLVEGPPDRKVVPAPKVKPADPATKPAPNAAEKAKRDAARKLDTLMRTAKALEKSNVKGAVENYREVVKEFPDSAEAKMAASRIKALTK